MTNKLDFAEWLKNILIEREMKPIDLSRLAKIDSGVVTRLLKAEREAKPDTLVGIARALKLPTDTVFRAAGLLPPQSPETELINRIVHLTSELPEEDQNEILAYAQLRHRIAEEREKNATKGLRKSSPKPGKA